MQAKRQLEQHIAIFGESGSGKTVLLSSFYGATQEPEFTDESPFHVVAEDFGQRARLHQNYLGMKNKATVPPGDRFKSVAYSFSLRFKDEMVGNKGRKKPFDAVRVVWHDYPGEWLHENPSSSEEAKRQVDTFKALLSSDVAMVLVDAQQLVEHRGEEERYLKHLVGTLSNGLLALKDDVLPGGDRLVRFPRIWILALAKADLMPDIDVFVFRDLLIEKIGRELGELRGVIEGFVEGPAALSVGEDFVLLSSARFSPQRIDVRERVGLDLMVPIAAVLPFERHLQWLERDALPKAVVIGLLSNVEKIAAGLLILTPKLPGPVGLVVGLVAALLDQEAVGKVVADLKKKLAESRKDDTSTQNSLTVSLGRFRSALQEAEKRRVLIRSQN